MTGKGKNTDDTALPQDRSEPQPEAQERDSAPHPLMALRDEMDALFENFLSGFERRPWGRGRRFDFEPLRRLEESFPEWRTHFARPHMPADVTETPDGYTIAVELPGLAEDDIEISASGNEITIRAVKKEETQEDAGSVHVRERHYGALTRTFTAPEHVNLDKAEATFKNGVLSVRLPKKALPKPDTRKIPIK
ncbi:MAG: Hsp20/alpha crystallin family protein [Alphaproteobacteria bacterium]|nr:Hsp20/alpha crystallin family protein [Alphaproteobacteria bacterium]MBF0250862.1 Hsp20/alpha crystallin family protein [Alphaproteobacteria bacterium]